MPNNKKVVESHGCIVCGKLYNLLVIYSPDGKLVDCAVTSMGGHRLSDMQKPLVACDRHTEAEIEAALARHKLALAKDEDREED